MVEKNRVVFHTLRENITKLKFPNITLRNDDGLNFAKRNNEQFDVIFLDPPFQSDYLPKLMPLLAAQLTPTGMLYIESGTAFEADEPWQVIKRGKAGAVHYQLMQYGQHERP